jgi:hypothetical protein
MDPTPPISSREGAFTFHDNNRIEGRNLHFLAHTLVHLCPIPCLVSRGAIATIAGCEASEAGFQQRVIIGLDIGEPLAIMGVL